MSEAEETSTDSTRSICQEHEALFRGCTCRSALFEAKAFGEIGTALRVSEDAARVRVNRALERMRGLLAKRGIRSTAAALSGLLAGNAAVAAPMGMAVSVTGAALAGGMAVVAAGSAAVGVGAAGAAGASGLGAGILSFMTTTKLVTGVACVVAAVSVGTAVYERNARQVAEDEISRLRSDAGRLSLRINDLERTQKETETRAKAEVDAKEAAQKHQAEAKAAQSIQNARFPSRTLLTLILAMSN